MQRSVLTAFALALISLVASLSSTAETLIAPGSTWAYCKGTNEASAPVDAWRFRGFNDAAWVRGKAPFYYDTDSVYTGQTHLSDMRNGYTSVYLRQPVVLTNVALISTLSLRFYCDDGFALWINGTLVTNFNKGGSDFTYNTTATAGASEPITWMGYTLVNPGAYLVNGTNLVAVQGFNRPITSSDFVLDLELTSTVRETEPPVISRVDPPPGTVASLTSITITFSEPVTGLGFSDLLINGLPAQGLGGSGSTYTFSFEQPAYGLVEISWDAGASIQDYASPPNRFDASAPAARWSYELEDTSPPQVRSINPAPQNTIRALTQIEVTFSEPVNGVDAGDLVLNGTGATRVSGGLAGPYVFEFTAMPPGTVQVMWAPGHGIRDRSVRANPFAGGSWSYVIDPAFTYQPVRISEFLSESSGTGGILDEDDDYSDWIELHNRGTNSVNLRGWSLSDEAGDPGKWTFPDVIMGPGQFLVVFASGKDRKPAGPGAKLHTNFKLNPNGEYLGLFDAEAPRQAVSQFAIGYPVQRMDISYGWDRAEALRYFAAPTPGAMNGTSTIAASVPPVHPNVGRGLFKVPFTLILYCPLPGAEIRYTTDGREPTAATGQIYSPPLAISRTTIVRAAAFKADHLPSPVLTESYLFLQSTLRQPNSPPGLPTAWMDVQSRTWTADYEMDPEIVDHPEYSGSMLEALQALPSISLVTAPEDMFDNTRGLYPKSQARGPAWERRASTEFIFPEGGTVQIDCGVQMQGNSVRDPVKTAKHSFRLVFKGDYGSAKLQARIFPDAPLAEFDTLTLRADFNNSWMHWSGEQRLRGVRVRDAFLKDLQRDMSGLSGHSRYFHLYVNGLYWGIYDPTERPDAAFAAAYLGGSKADFDVVNEGTLVDGNMTAYNTMLSIGNLADNAQYQLLQQYLDVRHHIDYMLLHFYAGHQDWGNNKNWYTVRRRAPGEGFKFITWDGEMTLNSSGFNRVSSSDTVSGLHGKLLASAQYRLDFADRVHKHLFNGGALTPQAVAARFNRRVQQIEPAIIAESARWGDYRRDVHQYSSGPYLLYTRNDHFIPERDRLLDDYFPGRTATVLSQLRSAGLYPSVDAPVFSRFGGTVPAGFELSLSAPSGTVYFTTNGVDPRVVFAGTAAPDARAYTSPIRLQQSAVVKARALNGSTWSALAEAAFIVGALLPPIRITEVMYHPLGGELYEFVELQNTGVLPLDVSGYALLGVDYRFPPGSVLAPGQVLVLASSTSPSSFATRYPRLTVAGYFDGALANGGERLTLIDRDLNPIVTVDFDDASGWPAAADGSGRSLEILDPLADPDDPANWRASLIENGSPGAIVPRGEAPFVHLNELMAENTGTVTNQLAAPDWIELHNASDAAVDISSYSLTDDSNPRKFAFPSNSVIPARGFLVLWCDTDYSSPGLHTGFGLARKGESVFLYDAATNQIDAVGFGVQLPNRTLARFLSTWSLGEPTPNGPNVAAELTASTNVIVNEWLAYNSSDTGDWIELFNRDTNRPAALAGLHVGHGTVLFQMTARSFLEAGGHIQLHADNNPGPDHLDFALSDTGGTINLLDPAGWEISRVSYSRQSLAVSQGRLPDGTGPIAFFPNSPSPGAANYAAAYSGPVFHELMAWNRSAVTFGANVVCDWVELFNPGTNTADLAGVRLATEANGSRTWAFPTDTRIAPGGLLVVTFNSLAPATTNSSPLLNTGFGLDRRSGGVYLLNHLGERWDGIEYGHQIENVSIGRIGATWQLLAQPTPGQPNSAAMPVAGPALARINEWLAEAAAADWIELYNTADQPIALAGAALWDDPSLSGTPFRFPPLSFIGARRFVLVTADADPDRGTDHAPFQLDGFGEAILFTDSALRVMDAVYFGGQTPGASEGRFPDGSSTLTAFRAAPTPEASNYLPLANALINEALAHTDPPFEDAIELFNPTLAPADISGWFLSDDPADFKKFRISTGTVLGPRNYLVFYENDFNGGNGSRVPFSLDSAAGDELWLSAADPAGNLTGYRAVARFGASANGISFGRIQTSVSDHFVPLAVPTFGTGAPATLDQFRSGQGAANSAPLLGPVVLSEIMYRPAEGAGVTAASPPAVEFVEIHNSSASPALLYDPEHPANVWQLAGGIRFAFPPGTVLPAGGVLVITDLDPTADAEAQRFREYYLVPDEVPMLGPLAGRLDNSGDTVLLLRPDSPEPETGFVPELFVEQVAYTSVAPWPFLAEASSNSLQRLDLRMYSDDPANWQPSPPTPGRIPGPNGSNRPPELETLADQTIMAGITLSVTNVATDPDMPAQTLSFRLGQAPFGAEIDAQTGVFRWRPALAQAPSTNSVEVVLTDSGTPPQSASQQFSVVVLRPAAPSLQSIRSLGGRLAFEIGGDHGPDYILQTSTNLVLWEVLQKTNSPALPFLWEIPIAPATPRRFFRIELGP